MVQTYFEIGRLIVEEEQGGQERALYGKKTLKELSDRLQSRFGRGYSVDNLTNMRRFYLAYGKSETLSRKLNDQRENPAQFSLSWSHYLKLMRISNPDERQFYEIEAIENRWSLSELQRQCDSALFERLALSRDKDEVKRLSKHGQQIFTPQDAIKDPYVLEFLGLPEMPHYSESDLEHKLIDHLQQFLLELGKGFTFVGRQERITFDEKHFRVDLVFYHRFLRCFVLIDLKIGEVLHQDLGQMQMYVHYYDRYVRTPEENPSIGIILCKEKNDSLVEITLPENNQQIFASRYLPMLPSKAELKALLDQYEMEG